MDERFGNVVNRFAGSVYMNNDGVLTALAEQLDCYQRLAKLAKTQHDHVQNSRTEDLLLVLSQRQTLLEQIARLEQTITPARKSWPEYLSGLSESDRDRAESMLGRTRQLLEEITASDRDDALVLQQRKFNLGRGINAATAARKFNRVYTAAAYGTKKAALDLHR
jgi:flagellar biosynthesis/type III secretory pathway chaperone